MKIGHPTDNAAAALTNGASAGPGAARPNTASATAAPAGASARIELSSSAATLLAGGANADFDAEKVARIAKAIGDGTFKIDPGAIADKMIANAQELLSKVKS